MSWKREKLKNVCEFIDGDIGKNYPSNGELFDNGDCLFLNTGNVTATGFDFTSCQFIADEKDRALRKGKLLRGDVVLTTRGTLGHVAYYSDAIPFDRIRINSGMLIARSSVHLLPNYLFYAFRDPMFQAMIDGVRSGSAQPQLPAKTLKEMTIPVPTLEEQKRIADILSAYDKLIENNRRQIALSEEAVQRFYKEWFVDLRFPGHETTPIIDGLPEGWKKVALGSFIESHIGGGWGSETSTSDFNVEAFVVRATDISDISNGNLSLPLRWHKESNFRTRSLAEGDIVFEVSGGSKEIGVGRSMIVSKQFLKALDRPVICASFCKKIRCRSVSDAHLLYEQIQMDLTAGVIRKYEKRSAGNIINFHWEDFLKSYQVIVPDDDTLNLFSIQISCIRKQAENCKMLCMLAKEARDRLLPKLMSGEIEVG